MRHRASPQFWRIYGQLPVAIQKLADKSFAALKKDPHYVELNMVRYGVVNHPGTAQGARVRSTSMRVPVIAEPEEGFTCHCLDRAHGS